MSLSNKKQKFKDKIDSKFGKGYAISAQSQEIIIYIFCHLKYFYHKKLKLILKSFLSHVFQILPQQKDLNYILKQKNVSPKTFLRIYSQNHY